MTSWCELIQGEADKDSVEHFRVISRRGAEFLVLPAESSLAVEALSIYPAQTPFAKAARWSLGLLLKAGFSFRQKRVSIAVDRRGWLGALIGQAPFAILCGNPASKGRRFIFLSFEEGCPSKIAKAGLGAEAALLISREAAFLRTAAGVLGVPRILDEHEHGELRAFSMQFAPGSSPKTDAGLSETLRAWIKPDKTPLSSIPQWATAIKRSEIDALKRAGSTEVSPVLSHGDFAPWNIREHQGRWTVIDWERGETHGVPGWDWLHFEIQTAVLVHKTPAAKVFSKTQRLLLSAPWTEYAARTGIQSIPNELLVAYLIHSLDTVGQTEGVSVLREVLEYATAKISLRN